MDAKRFESNYVKNFILKGFRNDVFKISNIEALWETSVRHSFISAISFRLLFFILSWKLNTVVCQERDSEDDEVWTIFKIVISIQSISRHDFPSKEKSILNQYFIRWRSSLKYFVTIFRITSSRRLWLTQLCCRSEHLTSTLSNCEFTVRLSSYKLRDWSLKWHVWLIEPPSTLICEVWQLSKLRVQDQEEYRLHRRWVWSETHLSTVLFCSICVFAFRDPLSSLSDEIQMTHARLNLDESCERSMQYWDILPYVARQRQFIDLQLDWSTFSYSSTWCSWRFASLMCL